MPKNPKSNKSQQSRQKFVDYYVDYLINYESIGSYAAHYELTYKTAKYRLQLGEQVFYERCAANASKLKVGKAGQCPRKYTAEVSSNDNIAIIVIATAAVIMAALILTI